MAYCNHPYDTQTNESLNNAIATVAPKMTCYSGTVSLFSRIALVMGIHNLGYVTYFSKLFHELEMEMTSSLMKFLSNRESTKECKRRYQRWLDVKAVQSKKQRKTIEQVLKERSDKSYGPGIALMPTNKKRKATDSIGNSNKTKKKITCKRGSTTHQRTTHHDCPLQQDKKPMTAVVDPFPPPCPPPPMEQQHPRTLPTTAVFNPFSPPPMEQQHPSILPTTAVFNPFPPPPMEQQHPRTLPTTAVFNPFPPLPMEQR